MNIEEIKNNKVFCLHPWVTQIKDNLGHVKLCPAKNNFNAETKDLRLAWNSDSIKQIRTNMMTGCRTDEMCEGCYTLDEQSIPSERTKSLHLVPIEKIEELLNDTSEDGTIGRDAEYLELSLDIKCESLCVQCNRMTSQKWKDTTQFLVDTAQHRVIKADFRTRYNFDEELYNWSNEGMKFWPTFWEVIPNVKHLFLTGGEPFESDKMIRLINELSQKEFANDLKVTINTTGNYVPKDMWETFKAFKKVTLLFSIDAVGEKAEWLRFPLNWDNFVSNVRLADEKNIHYEFTTNIHSLNLAYVPEIYEWLWESKLNNVTMHPIKFTFNHRPSYLDVRFVEQDTKQFINQKIWDFYGKYNQNHPEGYFQNLMGCLDFMWQHKDYRRNELIKEFVNTMDKTRNTKFSVLFSELDEKI